MTRPRMRHSKRQVAPRSSILFILVVFGSTALACRGKVSTKPPIRITAGMSDQAHILPQAALAGAAHRASMQHSIPGVVAREDVAEPGAYELGKTKQGYLSRIPIAVDEQFIARGEERFNIYCSVCHDRAGSGQGINPQRGFPGPVDLASDNTRRLPDGQIFGIIAQGVRNMPAVGDQVPVADRWPIVAWVRVLQRSQYAKVADVEPQFLSTILPEEAN